MPKEYVPASLAELYQQRADHDRKRLRNRRIVGSLCMAVIVVADIILLWPAP